MTQIRNPSGTHTWDIVIDYQKCPKCGFINEDRQEYHETKDLLTKEITCLRCKDNFEVSMKKVKRFGPLFGKSTPSDYMWD